MQRSRIVRRSIKIAGHETSIAIEDEFYTALRQIAREAGITISDFVTDIDSRRLAAGGGPNLSSRIRVAVLMHYRGLATARNS